MRENRGYYCAVIELLSEAIALGIRELIVKLDLQLIVLQLKKQYSVRNPQILRMYLKFRLLERDFDYITYQHILRHSNTLTDTLSNYILYIHLHHM